MTGGDSRYPSEDRLSRAVRVGAVTSQHKHDLPTGQRVRKGQKGSQGVVGVQQGFRGSQKGNRSRQKQAKLNQGRADQRRYMITDLSRQGRRVVDICMMRIVHVRGSFGGGGGEDARLHVRQWPGASLRYLKKAS